MGAKEEVSVQVRPIIGPELIDLLSETIKASKRDDRGFASLSEVEQRAGNQSSFHARNFVTHSAFAYPGAR
jgi:hypothetical protein